MVLQRIVSDEMTDTNNPASAPQESTEIDGSAAVPGSTDALDALAQPTPTVSIEDLTSLGFTATEAQPARAAQRGCNGELRFYSESFSCPNPSNLFLNYRLSAG